MNQIIILLGKSGSGKGTQAQLLADKFGYAHLISGDLLRNRAKKSDFTGKKLVKVLSAGGLAPTAVIFKLWLDRVERLEDTKEAKGLIMDGNPRKIKEAYLIDEAFDWYGWKNVKVILIDISDKEAALRLRKRLREDDNSEESVQKRLNWFKTEVQPVVDYYENSGRLVKINGEGSIDEVFSRVLKAIK